MKSKRPRSSSLDAASNVANAAKKFLASLAEPAAAAAAAAEPKADQTATQVTQDAPSEGSASAPASMLPPEISATAYDMGGVIAPVGTNVQSLEQKADLERQRADYDGFVKVSHKKQKSKRPVIVPNAAAVKQSLSVADMRNFGTSPGYFVHLIRQLTLSTVLWCLNDGTNPHFAMVQNRQNIRKMVVAHVPGLNQSYIATNCTRKSLSSTPIQLNDDFHRLSSQAPLANVLQPEDRNPATAKLADIFSHLYPVHGPGSKNALMSTVSAFVSVPFSAQEKKAREAKLKKKSGQPRKPLSCQEIAMTPEQMVYHNYPLHPVLQTESTPLEAGWVATALDDFTVPSDTERKLLAIDCEMCVTQEGYELTRLSVVNEQRETLYDELIMPPNPILDYVTPYSGITAAKMQGVTRTLQDAQQFLLGLVDDKTVLIGQSLENDLRALKFVHPYVIDTSVAIPHSSGVGFKAKLKSLAKKYLHRDIQQNQIVVDGAQVTTHDSVEDAVACLDLVLMRLAGEIDDNKASMADCEHISLRLKRGDRPKRTAWVDNHRSCYQERPFVDMVYVSDNDDQVLANTLAALQTPADFVWCRFREIEQLHDTRKETVADQPTDEQDKGETPAPDAAAPADTQQNGTPKPTSQKLRKLKPLDPEALQQGLNRTTERIQKLWDSLPADCALLVFSCNNDLTEITSLFSWRNALKPLMQWTTAHQIRLQQELEIAKMGCCMFAIKH
ncbi:hypothetical protein RI367_008253 [Sorochytrium milnesiophthora]